jgi:hypothetical protein
MRRATGKTAAVAIAAIAALSLLSGCGGARNSLGTSSSACYRTIPPALGAIGRKGKLVGVRKIGTASLRTRLPADKQLAAVKAKELCVLAFKGSYQPGDVPLAPNKKPGTYAVVAVTIKNPMVVAAFVLDHLPARFTHTR